MEFRLTYEGALPSSRSKGQTYDKKWKIKHHLRKHFHKQLKKYWQENSVLKSILSHHKSPGLNMDPIYEPMLHRSEFFNWLPLVIEQNNIECRLDILYLRNGARGKVVSKSDIDNRIKTLLDALKRPTSAEILEHAKPDSDEDPFFVLLEDDRVISHLSIETDTLLYPSGDASADVSTDSRIIIKVTIKPTSYSWMWDITATQARNRT